MRARLACLVSLVAAAAPALADTADQPAVHATEPATAQVAIAVNPPLRWKDADSVGISAYAGVSSHHAIRANFATYVDTGGAGATLIGDLFFNGDGSDAITHGRITDVGVSWMYFPRKLWSGAFLEAGLLRRARNSHVEDEFDYPEVRDTETAYYAGRGLAGWSWLFGDHVFVSVSAGLSVGHEIGRETTAPRADMPMEMRRTSDVSRSQIYGEGFIRLGGAFGM